MQKHFQGDSMIEFQSPSNGIQCFLYSRYGQGYNQPLWWRQDRRTYRMVWIYLDNIYRTNIVLAFERATSEDDNEPIIPRKCFMSSVLYFISSLNFVAL